MELESGEGVVCFVCGCGFSAAGSHYTEEGDLETWLCHVCAQDQVAKIGELVADALVCERIWAIRNGLSTVPLSYRDEATEATRSILAQFECGLWRRLSMHFFPIRERDRSATDEAENPAVRDPITKSMRYDIMHRDNFHCTLCGATGKDAVLVIDHIEPVAKGGETTMDNLQTLCEACNQGKRDKV